MNIADMPPIDDQIDPHLALWQSETYVSPQEQGWYRWIRKLESVFGHYDGTQEIDGYSLDNFYDMWEAGYTVERAIAERHIVLKR
jgi:hypothetical protein